MAIYQKTGKQLSIGVAKAASTAISANALVTGNGSGYVTPATSTQAAQGLLLVSQRTVASTDSDYASATVIPCQALLPGSTWVIDVHGTAATQANVGNSYDLYDSVSLNLSGTTYKPLTVVGLVGDGSQVEVTYAGTI